jgi:hypothetical protein
LEAEKTGDSFFHRRGACGAECIVSELPSAFEAGEASTELVSVLGKLGEADGTLGAEKEDE